MFYTSLRFFCNIWKGLGAISHFDTNWTLFDFAINCVFSELAILIKMSRCILGDLDRDVYLHLVGVGEVASRSKNGCHIAMAPVHPLDRQCKIHQIHQINSCFRDRN